MSKVVALIPLPRSSPLGPSLYTRPLAGRPLCDWTIRAALDSEAIGEVWVSTDGDEIAETAEACGARVFRCSTEQSAPQGAMMAFADAHPDFETLALIQAESPLTRPEHLDEAARLLDRPADCVVTVARGGRYRWSAEGDPLGHSPATRWTAEELPAGLHENGAFHMTRRLVLEAVGRSLGGSTAIYEMPAYTGFEIDLAEDRPILEALARRHGYSAPGAPIRLLALDVDGVLNDAGFYYSEAGEALKKFNTRDGAGLVDIMRSGVEVGLITGEKTGFAPARARKLGIARMELGCSDKLPVLDAWRVELGLSWDEVAYMGDDLADRPCVERAGVGACPPDAAAEVREVADFVGRVRGGHGAVRELIDDLKRRDRI